MIRQIPSRHLRVRSALSVLGCVLMALKALGYTCHFEQQSTYSVEGTRFGYFSCKKSEPQLCGVFIGCLQSLLGGDDLILYVHSSLFIKNESCTFITK